jgi:hypothetical protein
MVETAKVTLVTVVAVFEIEERLVRDLRALGHGLHGHRMAGLVDAPNMRIEMLVSSTLAHKILERIEKKYVDQPIMAYIHAVEAIPHEHFE